MKFSVAAIAALFLVFPASPSVAKPGRVDICHVAKRHGKYIPLSLPAKAFEKHVAHGDTEPGDEVPGMPGYYFGQNCAPVLPTNLQILAINDFHGNIATSSGAFGGTGRADFLAANIAAAEAGADNSIFVSAGDLIGASPLISALFHDEPTIEAMNLMGLDINGMGHHEFDEGPDELRRMASGGSHPVDGDLDGDPFAGADFEFLAANVVDDSTGETLFPPYTTRNFGGVEVAFIGVTLESTPSLVTPSGVAGLTFLDEADTVNALIPELQQQGIESIVVLIHEGGRSDGGQHDCGTGLTGPIAGIVPLLDDAVDLVIAGHTNDEFVCLIDGKWVTMADTRGRMFTDIDVTLNPGTRDMTVVAINNVANLQGGVIPDPTVTALIDKYDALSAPLANAVIGSMTSDIFRSANLAGESALGDVIADAQLAATAPVGFGESVVAFMNPGGIRDDMIFAEISGGELPGELTFGEAFGIQPFGNSLVTMTLTGAQIHTLLEQQFDNPAVGSSRILQVSDGFSYTWDASEPTGSKVDPTTIKIGGVVVAPGTGYRVTVNSFLATGGDGFSVLVDGTDRLGGEVDLDALVTYFGVNSPVAPGPQNRITRLN
jgi:5'-nucleotidase